jgi:hypothetical protein
VLTLKAKVDAQQKAMEALAEGAGACGNAMAFERWRRRA